MTAARAPANGDVTVVIACFNYGRFLLDAVDSALGQDGGAPHVIVVDDGSTDADTALALGEAERRGARVVRQQNRGAAAARNAGLALASTPYLLCLDADDRLAPEALSLLRPRLDRDPQLGFAYGWMRMFGDWRGVLRWPPYDPYRLLFRHMIGLSALMRSEVYEATGGFDARFAAFEDWELWINALAHGWRGRLVEAVTLENRRHGRSKLSADRARYRSAWRQLRAKHRALYDDRAALAAESGLGPFGRAAHRWFWGPRPLPATLETALQRALWAR
jgi:glycosyltransferase involved in cell wall biosynthesis